MTQMVQMVLPVVSFAKARIDGICSSTAGANGSESFKYLFYISVPSFKKGLIVLFDVVFLLLNACMVLGGMSHFPRHLEDVVLFGHLKNMGPVVAWALGGGATSGLTHILAHLYRAIISHFDLWARTIACRYPSPRVAIHHI